MAGNAAHASLLSVFLIVLFYEGYQAKRMGMTHKSLTLSDSSVECSGTSACKYAICGWKRDVNIDNDDCTFIDTSCRCPDKHLCALTNHVIPGSMVYAFEFRCKKPKTVLMMRKQSNNGNRNRPDGKGRRVSFYHRIGKRSL